jgi:hypothetical protein
VRTRENAHAQDVDVFINRRLHHGFHRHVAAAVDDFHAAVAECSSDDASSTVVTVHANLGYEYSQWWPAAFERTRYVTHRTVTLELAAFLVDAVDILQDAHALTNGRAGSDRDFQRGHDVVADECSGSEGL